MRILIVTKIFPNSAAPLSSPFNRQQFRELSRLCDVDVLATIPYFPGAKWFRRWSAAGKLVGVPESELIDGMNVKHPRYLYVPRVGIALAGPLYAASLLPSIWPLRRKVDAVLGSWAYPDGYAAVALARLLGVPAVVKLHGSDINVIAQIPSARRMLERALPKAARVVAVSRELGARAAELGVSEERIDIVENGVDRTLFYPQDRAQAREQLGFGNGRLILYVGRLEREKGVLDLVRAVNDLRLRSPNAPVRLALVGEGSARDECQGLVQELGAPVQFAGARPLEEIPIWMAAADVVTLPSHNEGCPNVVLEALASGRRVVATSVGAIPDIVRSSALGELVAPRDVYALTRTLDRAVKTEYDPETVALGSGTIDWPQSALQLYRSIQHAVGGPELGGSPRLRVAA